MEWSSKYIYVLILIFYLADIVVKGQIVATLSPSTGVRVGAMVSLTCTLPANMRGMVIWQSKRGELAHSMGTDTLLHSEYAKTNRYAITKEGAPNRGLKYTLTIKNAKAEDTSELGCKLQNTDNVAWAKLAVCEDVSSSVCKCISSYGWRHPKCFETPQQAVDNAHAVARRTAIGLGVCLGIAILYGVVVTLIVFWDCTQRIAEKKKRSMQQSSGRPRRSAYDDSDRLELDPNDTESQADSNYGSQETRSSASHNNPAFRYDEDARQRGPSGDAPPMYIDLQRPDQRKERALYADARNGDVRAGGHHQGALSPDSIHMTDSPRDSQPPPRQRGRRGQFTDYNSPQRPPSDTEAHQPVDRRAYSPNRALDHSPGGYNRSRDRGHSAEPYGTPDRLSSPNSSAAFPFPPRQEESGPGAFTPVKPGEYTPRTPGSAYSAGQSTPRTPASAYDVNQSAPRTPGSAYSVGQSAPRTPVTPGSAGNIYENTRGTHHDRSPYRNAYDNSGSANGYSRSNYDDFPANRSGHSEPRRLEFRDDRNRAPSPKHNGPYIDKTNTVV